MASFEIALPWTLKHEGGWSFDSDDPGGATNMGITMATAIRHGIHSPEELMHITPEQVAEIYRRDYWVFDGVNDQRVATKLFDMAVNVGLATAVHMAQAVLNDLGAGLREDGLWGPVTQGRVNQVAPDQMLDLLCMEQAAYYKAIVTRRPASRKFLKGWLNRAGDKP